MDRRAFFRSAFDKGQKVVVEHLSEKAEQAARAWIRPPFAREELEFLLACTRCGACIDACPHQVVFPLPARVGLQAAGTPALDLLNKGCHLCADWPCVTACEPHALHVPEVVEAAGHEPPTADSPPVETPEAGQPDDASVRALPRLAAVVVDTDRCLPYSGPECGACVDHCTVGALTLAANRPVIDAALCTGCALCREQCVTDPPAMRLQVRKPAVPAVFFQEYGDTEAGHDGFP